MTEKDLDKVLWIVCNEIGIPHNLNGCRYIKSAVKKCLADKSKLEHVCKGLYPEIAEENNSTGSRVERGIRHAIEVCWARGNVNLVVKMFGYTVSANKGRPTNTEFISYMCDFIELFGEDVLNGTYKF